MDLLHSLSNQGTHWLQQLELDRSSFPLHRAVSDAFRALILAGEIPAHSMLPSEPQLARHLGISRFTLRQALDTLAREGLIRREHGRGNIILGRAAEGTVGETLRFSFERDTAGTSSRIEVRLVTESLPPPHVAGLLALDPTEPVIQMLRVRLQGRDPVAVEQIHLPRSAGRGLDQAANQDLQIPQIVSRCYGVPPTSASISLTATLLDPEVAALLGLPTGAVGLVRETVFRMESRPVALERSFHPPDRVSYQIEHALPPSAHPQAGSPVRE